MSKKKKEWKPDGYLKAAFRKIWRWSPKRREVLKGLSCASCGRKVAEKAKRADHVSPVVDPRTGFIGWDEYYRRMFCGELQLLCDPCHKEKTKQEAKERKEARKLRKAA